METHPFAGDLVTPHECLTCRRPLADPVHEGEASPEVWLLARYERAMLETQAAQRLGGDLYRRWRHMMLQALGYGWSR